eukprot:Blabericola_migrator_1__4009@NODE_2218_length_3108_cov_8_238737_g1397_i0_p1_GENE_NODE_2218_length_3108_cov_8_238737_g1397_i0NODE_2218_length_3108_cov_8_238737_g1397_i0_p1_ORF_typecomplete_len500_score87_16RasGAP_C/PF03836_15/0_12RasGAP_C/PF03836_15/3_4RasGAP_C/PF03836_15/6_5e03BAR_3_WASP_bdg/PF10456_9/6e02BAR_3_WASP_bdg/PF10456_9/0_015BAR_3_WASP_bdg/PF10456_9/2_8e03TBK1_CCD1/PF18394_1/0_02TBK1_CCD1/PF18394_1/9_9e03AAA_13/PF13166_6/0_31PhoU_div/PF01865_16/1_2PhoU_div/PF01865_16/29Membr_traf_MHD/P
MKGRSVQTSRTDDLHLKELLIVLLCPQNQVYQERSDFEIPINELRQESWRAARFLKQRGRSLAAREFLRALSPCLAHPDLKGDLLPIIRVEKETCGLLYAVNFETPHATLDECWQSFVHQLDEVVGLKTAQISLHSLKDYDIEPITVYGRRGVPNAPVELSVNSILRLKDFDRIKSQVEAGIKLKKSYVELDSGVAAAWSCKGSLPSSRDAPLNDYFGSLKLLFSDAIEKTSHKQFVTPTWHSVFNTVVEMVGQEEKRLRDEESRELDSIARSLNNVGCYAMFWSGQREEYIKALNQFATKLSTVSTFTRVLEDQEPVERLTTFVKKQLEAVKVLTDVMTEVTDWHDKAKEIGEQVQELETYFETCQTDEAVHRIKRYLVASAKTFQEETEKEVQRYGPVQFKYCLERIPGLLEVAEVAAQALIACDKDPFMLIEERYDGVTECLQGVIVKLKGLLSFMSVEGALEKVDEAQSKLDEIVERVNEALWRKRQSELSKRTQ